MARVAIPITVLNATGDAQAGKSVTVRKRSDSSLAVIYTTEAGGTTAANPLTTDANGRVTAWAERGAYKLTVTGSGITTYDEMFDSMPASDGGIDVLALAATVVPLGIVLPYGGAAAPGGGNWLLCDGSSLLRAGLYAPLFGIIGTVYGAADGTHFNLPNLLGRVPLGAGTPAGAPGGTAHALGALGGEETHTLLAAESGLPAHNHPDGFNTLVTAGGTHYAYLQAPADVDAQVSHSATNGGNNAAANAANAHNTLPPFNVVNYIIRAV